MEEWPTVEKTGDSGDGGVADDGGGGGVAGDGGGGGLAGSWWRRIGRKLVAAVLQNKRE